MNDQRRTFDPAAVPSAEVLFEQKNDVFAQKVRWTIRKLAEMKERRARVLVVTRDDTSASSVQAACVAAGINSCKLVKTTTIHDQEQMVMAFRDPDSDLDAVVALFNSCKGLRASHACRNGILVQYPLQFSTYAEVTSVLTYPSQVDKPVWDVALVNETLDVVEEAALARSAAASFIQNQQVHPFPHAQHKVIHAFYLAAICMGKDHSHLPHCRTHWSSMESPEIEREGRFYFALGQYVDHVPEDAHKVDGETIIQIAKSWVPGTPLTYRHVNGMLPAHANGVVLFNYVMGGYVTGML